MSTADNDWIYDSETICNFYSVMMMHAVTGTLRVYEFSEWENDTERLVAMIQWMQRNGQRLVGFNNEGFDYPILHAMLNSYGITATAAYDKAQSIISGGRFGSRVWDDQKLVPQVDLYLIHHFDNPAKSTSLKSLEFAMRSHRVQEMPVDHRTPIVYEQRQVVLDYQFNDVAETVKFYWKSRAEIEFRESLDPKFLNYNDGKIGKQTVIDLLERASPGACYVNGTREPRQTRRPVIHLRDVIFPYITFDEPEFTRIRDWFATQSITETKGVFSDVSATVRGFRFDFGVGGIHGSVLSEALEADAEYTLHDVDVAALYPSIGIANRLFPEHLGSGFADHHRAIVEQRKQHAKGTPENAMLKLAANSVFGDSNNMYSPFYDPQYTMAITINGQLLLCMLAEKLMALPTVRLIQINTDGMTMRVRRDMMPLVREVCAWWESATRLTLEHASYSRMWIRDVNSYLSEVEGTGKIKRKGAYRTVQGQNLGAGEIAWHQDSSELIIPLAVEAAMIEGASISAFIHGHRDLADFMLRAKVNRGTRLCLADGTPLPSIVRYYVSTDGQPMFKVMPPPPGRRSGDYKQGTGVADRDYLALNQTGVWNPAIHTKNQSTYDLRPTGIKAGQRVTICNVLTDARRENIDYVYYIREAEALAAAAGYRRPVLT